MIFFVGQILWVSVDGQSGGTNFCTNRKHRVEIYTNDTTYCIKNIEYDTI